jgi:hypothetical protein
MRGLLRLGVAAAGGLAASDASAETMVGGHGAFDVRYLRVAEEEAIYDGLADTGLALRAFAGHENVALALGLDFHFGGTHPAGFVHAGHLRPLGVAFSDGAGLRLSATAGIGFDGVTSLVPTALRLPADFLFELPLGDCVKVEVAGELAWLPREATRKDGSPLDGVDEAALAIRARIDRRYDEFEAANGYFIGLELGERLQATHIGVAVGYGFEGAGSL